MCASVQPEKCEVCLAGFVRSVRQDFPQMMAWISRKRRWREFLAKYGANLRELLIISLPPLRSVWKLPLLFLHNAMVLRATKLLNTFMKAIKLSDTRIKSNYFETLWLTLKIIKNNSIFIFASSVFVLIKVTPHAHHDCTAHCVEDELDRGHHDHRDHRDYHHNHYKHNNHFNHRNHCNHHNHNNHHHGHSDRHDHCNHHHDYTGRLKEERNWISADQFPSEHTKPLSHHHTQLVHLQVSIKYSWPHQKYLTYICRYCDKCS